MTRPAITIENISKCYRIGHLGKRLPSFREAVASAITSPFRRSNRNGNGSTTEIFWALQDISFEVFPGEVVGILGRNGAGKSTLLKVLSRITEPTTGQARINGRLASLLEVGTGFHSELSGRENIYLNGSILGMKKVEIDRKFDEIVAFAEVEQFLDTQVKYYSSGMYVRLAFAVAAHLETQILIVDEVLAVGDIGFQNRCLGRIEEVTKQGRTVLFVSHNVPAVQNLCTRCVLLERGRLKIDGDPETVLNVYNQSIGGLMSAEEDLTTHPGRGSDSVPCMKRVRVTGRSGDENFIRMGDDIQIEIAFDSPEPLTDIFCRAYIKNNLNSPVFGFDTDVVPPEVPKQIIRNGRIFCRVDRAPLMPGTYSLDLFFGSHRMVIDTVHEACRFEIHPADVFSSGRLPQTTAGSVYCPHSWEVSLDEPSSLAAAAHPGENRS